MDTGGDKGYRGKHGRPTRLLSIGADSSYFMILK